MMNCYVSPRDNYDIDSISGILKDVINQCHTLKSEGGWGQNFSWIRPRGSFIHGIGVETPGAVKYMEIYDKTSDVITSGSGRKSMNKKAKGKIRKGAMMGVMDCWHPDIEEFIRAKQQPGRLTKFNVSVNCTDEFMDKVIRVMEMKAAGTSEEQIELEDMWNLRFPVTTFERYKEEWDGDIKKWEGKGYPVSIFRTVSATKLWETIMESTYNRAEPGVLFLDRANYFGPLSYLETIFATNPCGEQTLAPGGVCNLGSINLAMFINDDRTGFNLDAIRMYTQYLNRFLDNINTLSNAPLPEYIDSMRKKRRVGIGILGWGSALFMLKVRFGSKKAAELREQVMKTIAQEAYMSSIDLAEEKGMFEYCIPEKHANGIFVNSLGLSA
jgi:ribonucleoside-diphosphate reductase alpha chain